MQGFYPYPGPYSYSCPSLPRPVIPRPLAPNPLHMGVFQFLRGENRRRLQPSNPARTLIGEPCQQPCQQPKPRPLSAAMRDPLPAPVLRVRPAAWPRLAGA